ALVDLAVPFGDGRLRLLEAGQRLGQFFLLDGQLLLGGLLPAGELGAGVLPGLLQFRQFGRPLLDLAHAVEDVLLELSALLPGGADLVLEGVVLLLGGRLVELLLVLLDLGVRGLEGDLVVVDGHLELFQRLGGLALGLLLPGHLALLRLELEREAVDLILQVGGVAAEAGRLPDDPRPPRAGAGALKQAEAKPGNRRKDTEKRQKNRHKNGKGGRPNRARPASPSCLAFCLFSVSFRVFRGFLSSLTAACRRGSLRAGGCGPGAAACGRPWP